MARHTCEQCGDEFRAPPSQDRDYCSISCSNKARSNAVDVACGVCGTTFSVPPSKEDRARFCSKECKHEAQRKEKIRRVCETCGEKFEVYPSRVEHADYPIRYCSRDCYGEAKQIYTEDDLTCDECGTELTGPRKHGMCKSCERQRFWAEERGYVKKCQECGAQLPPTANPDQLYCNQDCYATSREGMDTFYDASKPKVHKDCEVCGQEMVLQQWRSDQRFCSYRCSNIGEPRLTGDTYECQDGHVVRSKAERTVDNWLTEHGIEHEYEPTVADRFLADWQVGDMYIEFWGFPDDEEYQERMEMKREAYEEQGLELLDLYPWDLDQLEAKLSPVLGEPGR